MSTQPNLFDPQLHSARLFPAGLPEELVAAEKDLDAELKRLKWMDAVAANKILNAVTVIRRHYAALGRIPVTVPFEEQSEELDRVAGKLGAHVMAFYDAAIASGAIEFHAADLQAFIEKSGLVCAPDSPGRILRLLHRAGKLAYMVVNRRSSLYRFLP